jgi:IPT/TIG domain
MTGSGMGFVKIDGGESHTHLPGAKLNQFMWKKGSVLLSNKTVDTISLPTGDHSVSLTVIDDHGYEATELTTITVFPFGYPAVASIEPNSGSIQGGDRLIIKGSGFDTGGSNDVKVHFGIRVLDGTDIEIIDNFTLHVVSCPPHILGAPVLVAVETPLATSNTVSYTYVAGAPILFSESVLISSKSPAVAQFGPDRKLYVGAVDGLLSKYTLDDTYTSVVGVVSSYVFQYRAILGIAFDPMEVETDNPAVYITHSFFFHYEWRSTFGYAVNGKVSIVRGANLDVTGTFI